MNDQVPLRSFARIAAPPRRVPHPADPCAMVIFGGSGDLTTRLLMPALYNLAHTKLLPDGLALIGLGQTDRSTEDWREDLHGGLKRAKDRIGDIDETVWRRLGERM